MITIFDEPAIASPSLLSDIDRADSERNAYARLIADDAVAGKPLESYYAKRYAEDAEHYERLAAALHERVRRYDALKNKQDAQVSA